MADRDDEHGGYGGWQPYEGGHYPGNFGSAASDYGPHYVPGYDIGYGGYDIAIRTGGTDADHSGIGPRGYQRSDERIHEEVNERLTWNADLDATDIDVRVEHGEVTLSGAVESRAAKRLAGRIADHVPGVNDVHNELEIRRGAPASGPGG